MISDKRPAIGARAGFEAPLDWRSKKNSSGDEIEQEKHNKGWKMEGYIQT